MENPAVTQGSKLLKALGNKKRLEVMYILREGEQKVGDLEKIIGLSQSALSQHLAVLPRAKKSGQRFIVVGAAVYHHILFKMAGQIDWSRVKKSGTTERADRTCRLFFEFLHPAAGGDAGFRFPVRKMPLLKSAYGKTPVSRGFLLCLFFAEAELFEHVVVDVFALSHDPLGNVRRRRQF